MTQPTPEAETTIQMTEREYALYSAGMALGRSAGLEHAAKHVNVCVDRARSYAGAAALRQWLTALVVEVSKLVGAGGKRGGQNSGKQLAAKVALAVGEPEKMQAGILQFFAESAKGLNEEAARQKAAYGAAMRKATAAPAGGGKTRSFARRLLDNLLVELDRERTDRARRG